MNWCTEYSIQNEKTLIFQKKEVSSLQNEGISSFQEALASQKQVVYLFQNRTTLPLQNIPLFQKKIV